MKFVGCMTVTKFYCLLCSRVELMRLFDFDIVSINHGLIATATQTSRIGSLLFLALSFEFGYIEGYCESFCGHEFTAYDQIIN